MLRFTRTTTVALCRFPLGGKAFPAWSALSGRRARRCGSRARFSIAAADALGEKSKYYDQQKTCQQVVAPFDGVITQRNIELRLTVYGTAAAMGARRASWAFVLR